MIRGFKGVCGGFVSYAFKTRDQNESTDLYREGLNCPIVYWVGFSLSALAG